MASKLTVGYVRQSVEDANGVSIAAQTDRIKQFVSATGRGKVDAVYSDDGASGKDLNRKSMQRLLNDVKAGKIGTIVVLKLDRLSRSLFDTLSLLKLLSKRGCSLLSVTEMLDTQSAAGSLLIQILSSFSEFERRSIADRVANAKAYRRRSGRVYTTFTPFGYRVVSGKLVARKDQQEALALMRRMRPGGTVKGATLQVVCDELTRRKIAPPRGKAWRPSSVRAVLNSRMAKDALANLEAGGFVAKAEANV